LSCQAVLQIIGIAIFHADMPSEGAKIFGGTAFLARGCAAVLAFSVISEIFAAIKSCTTCDGGVFLHIFEEFACSVGTSGFWGSAITVVTGLSIGTSRAIVDLSIAIVVDAIADLRAACAGLGIAFCALAVVFADALSALLACTYASLAALAEVGKGFIDLAIAIVVFTVA
jgi:hypothetical protein